MNGQFFTSALLLLFIALKLTGFIDWSWWWVLSPLWIPLSIAALCVVVLVVSRWLETPRQRAARELQEYADALRERKP